MEEISTDQIFEAAFLISLGHELLRKEETEFNMAFVFKHSMDAHNSLLAFRRLHNSLRRELDDLKRVRHAKKRISKDPLADAGKVFKDSTRRIKGAPMKGVGGRWKA